MALTGRRILITRTRQQASELAARLEAAGAETIVIPTIEVVPPSSFGVLDAALGSLQGFDWVIFTSANAVHAFDGRAKELGMTPHPQRVAVIGPATAKAAQGIGLTVELMPLKYVAESLAEALLPFAAGASMLLVRAEEARDVLPETLLVAGARLTVAPAYRKVVPAGAVEALKEAFTGQSPDAVTFTSSSTATNLIALLESAGIVLPASTVLASIGPITSQTLRELGYPATIEASEPTITALCEALVEHFR